MLCSEACMYMCMSGCLEVCNGYGGASVRQIEWSFSIKDPFLFSANKVLMNRTLRFN